MADAPFSRGAVQRLLLLFKSQWLRLAVFSEAVGRYARRQLYFRAVKRPFLSFHAYPVLQNRPGRPNVAQPCQLLV